MSTHAARTARPATIPWAALLLGAAAVAAASWIGAHGLQSRHAFLYETVPVLLIPVAAWLFFSEREELTLAVLLLYLGLLDGFLKLASGSSIATLGRDVLLYAIALGALARMTLRQAPVRLPPLSGLVLAWIAVCVIQLANPADISLLHAAASLRQHLEFVPLFFLGYAALRSERRLVSFFVLLVFVAALNGVVSLIQSGLSPSQLATWGPGYATYEFGSKAGSSIVNLAPRTFINAAGQAEVRPLGLGGEDGFGGMIGLIALPGAVFLLTSLRRTVKIGWVVIPLTILVITGIVTSQTRLAVVGSVIALVAYLSLTLTSRRGIAALLVSTVVVVAGFYTLSAFTSSNANRYASISPSKILGTAVTSREGTMAELPGYITKYPLGAGLGSTGAAAGSLIGGNATSKNLNGESELTFLIAETGIPGLIVMLAFTLVTIRAGFVLRRVADPGLQQCLMALTAVLISLLAAWIFGPVTSSSPSSPFIWLSAGCIAYWYGEARQGRLRLRQRQISRTLALR